MTKQTKPVPPRAGVVSDANALGSADADRPFLPLLVLLFIGSGCAALIYEVVWQQMLSLVVGSSAISLGVVLGTFMGGMCAGSLLLSRYVSRSEHPLRVYAKLEAGIAMCGAVLVFLLPLIGKLQIAVGLGGFPGLLLSGLFCAIVLLPPTLMMGATLPAISRFVEATPRGVSWLGFFYGGNIVGGVMGCLLAGYYLLRLHDVQVATGVAVVLNVIVVLLAFALAKNMPYAASDKDVAKSPAQTKLFDIPAGSMPVYITIGLSGFTALASEVVWTRLLSLNLGATTYTFSLILAVFLTGLGLGSSTGAVLARTVENARSALGWCQLLLVAGIAWAAFGLTKSLPYWPVNPQLASGPVFIFTMDLVKTAFVVLPGAVLWGASFPLALAAIGSKESDPGVLVGTTYAANTIGAIFGSVLASLVFIPGFGTQRSHQLLLVLAAISAMIMLVFRNSTDPNKKFAFTSGSMAAFLVTIGVTGYLITTIIPVPPLLVGYGRFAAIRQYNHGEFIFTGEGMNSSMTVSRLSNGVLNYHNAGKVQASSEPQDMRLQRMLGHMATLFPKQAPTDVLVIACGAGVTAGAASIDPRNLHQVIAEIEPLVPKVVSREFGAHNFNVVDRPNVTVQVDDARHFLMTNKKKYDAITSDPFDPWVKGAAGLYSEEFFELVKDRLNDGGVVTVFVQLYESNVEAVKSEVGTFLKVFPDGLVFGNTFNDQGYDVVLVGQKTPGPIDVDAIQARLLTPEYAPVAKSLSEIGIYSAIDLVSTFAARGDQLKPWLADVQINKDKNLRLQYLAGFSLNMYDQAGIYSQMIQSRTYPEGLFTGSPETIAQLRDRIR
jgi:spermidine synthase